MTTNDHACVAMTPWITLHSTPWISDFHVNYCFEHVPKLCEHASSMGVLEGGGGGGGNRFPGLVAKQAVEFPQVLASVLCVILVTGSGSCCPRSGDLGCVTSPRY